MKKALYNKAFLLRKNEGEIHIMAKTINEKITETEAEIVKLQKYKEHHPKRGGFA